MIIDCCSNVEVQPAVDFCTENKANSRVSERSGEVTWLNDNNSIVTC